MGRQPRGLGGLWVEGGVGLLGQAPKALRQTSWFGGSWDTWKNQGGSQSARETPQSPQVSTGGGRGEAAASREAVSALGPHGAAASQAGKVWRRKRASRGEGRSGVWGAAGQDC